MRRNPRNTGVMIWVLLAPFLLLSLIHPSVMPARAADGTLTMVLCSVDGPGEVTIDLATGLPVEKAPSDHPDHCDWACGQMTGACVPRLDLPAFASGPATRADLPPPALVLHVAAATGLPPATGPPSA